MEKEVDSGANTHVLLASYDQNISLWKTSQLSLLAEWEEFSETWPRSGMTRNGNAYALPTSVLRIEGNESGLWPTPRASEIANGAKMANVANPRGNLEEVVYARTFPTPTASDAETHPNDTQRFDSLAAHIHLEKTGQLNPTWVEWLMGYPLQWTDLKD